MAQVRISQEVALRQRNAFIACPMKDLPAGIFWERTGGKTHRVVIRRQAEVLFDLSALLNA
jgi:hypothetical protein